MQLEKGNMWSVWDKTDLFIITTNSTLKTNDAVVMGAGIAKEARDRFPGVDIKLGKAIKKECGHLGTYGFLVSEKWPKTKLGIFQVKWHYQKQAAIKLISYSMFQLRAWLFKQIYAKNYPLNMRIDMNFPGIGNGKLDKRDIFDNIDFPSLENFHLWEKK